MGTINLITGQYINFMPLYFIIYGLFCLIRWSSGHIGHKNEFKVALLGLREAHPDIPIYLFTNIENVEPDISSLIDVIHVVDLLKEGGLDKIVKETGDLKFGFATKAQSLITGWERKIIPDKVIHLDVDIAIVRSTQFFNLEYAIEPLQVISSAFCAMPASKILKPGCVLLPVLRHSRCNGRLLITSSRHHGFPCGWARMGNEHRRICNKKIHDPPAQEMDRHIY